ncbi:hypothetical protein QAD02_007435 [Eretmocerus hayati]|uniref:Uncharacterized protein n=1 Tax=Eretmocerus hayati TaxID=131215 RepID=A0ACC2N498_9HYME|nr:hypothetical protein QAD02_007435 [Eretmocerus hayati]
MPFKTVFDDKWLDNPGYSDWLEKKDDDKHSFYRKLCKKTRSLSNMGERALTKHANSDHLKNAKKLPKKKSSITTFMQKKNVEVCKKNSGLPPTLKGISNQNAVETVGMNTSRQNSLTPASKLMLPRRKELRDFQLGRTKLSYSITHGLALYFAEELISSASHADGIVVGFDESLNQVLQKNQMDVAIKFFNKSTGEVETRYLTSVFLQHCKAEDLLKALLQALFGLDLELLAQVSLDGPNVNLSLLELLKKYLAAPFSFDDLSDPLTQVMSRFVQPDKLRSISNIIEIDLKKESGLIPGAKIDLPFATRDAIRQCRKSLALTDEEIINFSQDCRSVLVSFCSKLFAKSPLKWPLVQAIPCFDPKIAANVEVCKALFSNTLEILIEHKWISGCEADHALLQLIGVCKSDIFLDTLKSFKKSEDRLDHLWLRKLMAPNTNMELSEVLQLIFTLSHGNACGIYKEALKKKKLDAKTSAKLSDEIKIETLRLQRLKAEESMFLEESRKRTLDIEEQICQAEKALKSFKSRK